MASGPITSWQVEGGKSGSSDRFYVLGLQITAEVTAAMKKKKKIHVPWKESYDKPRQRIKKWRHHFADKGPNSQSYGFSSSHVCIWELDHKEGWVLKNWCFRILVLEKTLESPLDCREIQSVNPKGNQPWIFTGGTDAEAEAPILWPSDAKSRLIGKDPDAWKDWGQEEKPNCLVAEAPQCPRAP